MSGRRKGPTPLEEALEGYLAGSGLAEKLAAASVVPQWAERVGAGIADVAKPLRVSDGTLLVAVRSSAWLMELRLMEAEILRRLNEGRERGRIRQIRFVMGDG